MTDTTHNPGPRPKRGPDADHIPDAGKKVEQSKLRELAKDVRAHVDHGQMSPEVISTVLTLAQLAEAVAAEVERIDKRCDAIDRERTRVGVFAVEEIESLQRRHQLLLQRIAKTESRLAEIDGGRGWRAPSPAVVAVMPDGSSTIPLTEARDRARSGLASNKGTRDD